MCACQRIAELGRGSPRAQPVNPLLPPRLRSAHVCGNASSASGSAWQHLREKRRTYEGRIYPPSTSGATPTSSAAAVERTAIEEALGRARGVVSRAATEMGLSVVARTEGKLMDAHGG
jgi:transcriptional regulator with GAF, ATPase, and Fis domain